MNNGLPSDLTGLSQDALDELDRLFADEGIATTAGITRRATPDWAPMSFSQELLWLLDRATPGLTAYNLPIVRRLRGALDVDALGRALTTLAARHEVLRTRFADVDGQPRQIVDAPAPVALHRVDASAGTPEERERAAERAAREAARAPFDLANEHLFRATLVRIADDDHVLVLASHHIVVDGWSLGIVFRELAEAYAAARDGREPALPALDVQFGDYAAWQREQLAGPRLEELLTFWRAQLGDATEPLNLPTDRPRPTAPTFAGARQTTLVSGERLAGVKRLAQSNDATLYMVLLAAYATVLHRYTGREDVLIGSGSAGRGMPSTDGMVGYLNNTLVQHADFAGDPTFAELLGRVRASALGAYDHQDIPLEKLVLELRQGDARLSHAPLFEVVLTMQDAGGGALSLGGLEVEPFGIDFGATKFDITLLVAERDDELGITAQYRSDLFAPETMRRFLGHLERVLDAAVADDRTRVEAIDLLTPDERARLAAFNDTQLDEGPATTLVALFEAQAARVPDRAAVVSSSATLTYAELNARANRLAHRLRDAGADVGQPVGLALDRSADALVGLIGILKAGGCYVPLPHDLPDARRQAQLRESGAGLVVTDAAGAAALPGFVRVVTLDDADASPATNPAPAAEPASTAYVLYTSGSTGTPKGVAVTHANVVHYVRAVSRVLADVPAEAPGDGLAALDGWHFGLASTLAADLGNTSLFPAVLSGGTLHVFGKEVTMEPERFAEYVAAHPLDLLKITPNHLLALAAGRTGRDLAAVLPGRWTVLGGEALRFDVARTLLGAGQGRVLNHYGPTETTVGVCTFEVTAASLAAAEAFGAQTVPIGRPLANTQAFVVDARGAEHPVGIPGELWLGGDGVAAGYLGRPDLTAERFVTRDSGLDAVTRDSRLAMVSRAESDVASHESRVATGIATSSESRPATYYTTGDRVRRLPDGTIEFLGRVDHQVKVRGFRVELGEIEQALAQHPGVAQSVVMLLENGTDAALVAYVVPKQAGYAVSHADRPTPERLTAWLGASLPEYMVPATVVLLEAMPLTANGKIDRRALPAPDVAGAAAEDAFVAPRTPTEEQLAAIWADVLKKERVGATDNFLALGGHSLMAIRVLGKISKSFGVRLPLRTLFDTPTVEQLAAVVDAERAAAPAAGPSGAGGIGSISRDAHRIGRTAPTGASGGDHEGAS